MVIKKQILLFTVGGIVRVYKTFNPEQFYVVSPFSQPVSFTSVYEAFNFAYALYSERFGDELKNDES